MNEQVYEVYAVRESGLGGYIALHDYGAHLSLQWGVSGAWSTTDPDEADAMVERASRECGEPCVRSDRWVPSRTAADYSPNLGGVLT